MQGAADVTDCQLSSQAGSSSSRSSHRLCKAGGCSCCDAWLLQVRYSCRQLLSLPEGDSSSTQNSRQQLCRGTPAAQSQRLDGMCSQGGSGTRSAGHAARLAIVITEQQNARTPPARKACMFSCVVTGHSWPWRGKAATYSTKVAVTAAVAWHQQQQQ